MNDRTCFFVTPIGPENSDERENSDDVMEFLLEDVCNTLDLKLKRIDEIAFSGKIDTKIINCLEEATLVIADISFENLNVYYEIGYRHATKKPMILIKRKDQDDNPFDLTTMNTVHYGLNARDLEPAKNKIKEIANAILSETDRDESIKISEIESLHTKADRIITHFDIPEFSTVNFFIHREE